MLYLNVPNFSPFDLLIIVKIRDFDGNNDRLKPQCYGIFITISTNTGWGPKPSLRGQRQENNCLGHGWQT